MKDKQYADMTTIMQFGRIFADQILLCMKHAGLLEPGFIFRLSVEKGYEGFEAFQRVELAKNFAEVPADEWEESAMAQFGYGEGREWSVYHDPKAEAGSLPTEVYFKQRSEFRSRAEASRKAADKPLPPDGLWISRYDYDDPVGGGR